MPSIPIDNYFEVTEVATRDPKDELLTNVVYSINVVARLTYLLPGFDQGEDETIKASMDWFDEHSRVELKTPVIKVAVEYLTKDFVQQKLISMGVPAENYMVEEILSCAKRMGNNHQYQNRKVLRMKAKFDLFVVDELQK